MTESIDLTRGLLERIFLLIGFGIVVFTKKFTAFDRNNNIIADSPFHGFFTLGWIAFVVFVLQLATANWLKHGNILGTNEIMEMMFHRDLIVLGLSDGAMCLATGFGLLLQKSIRRGYVSWNREGWIIQSVSICYESRW